MTTSLKTKAAGYKTGKNVTIAAHEVGDPFADLPKLRGQLAADLKADKAAKTLYLGETEDRQAALTQRGYKNADALLRPEHRERLVAELKAVGISTPSDDLGLLSSIAKLQLGYANDGGKWVVKSRRDQRLAELYRIIYLQNKDAERNSKPLPWDIDKLAKQLAEYPGRIDGLKKAFRNSTQSPEAAASYEKNVTLVAQHDSGLGKLPVPGHTSMNTGKNTNGFVLALVSITEGVATVHTLIEKDVAVRAALKSYVPTKAEELRATSNAAAKA